MSINAETREETFSLPVSKTDLRAVGCTRTWVCVCDGSHSTPCAYHAMLEQLDYLRNKFPNVPFEELPLFPRSDGQAASNIDAVKYIFAKLRDFLGNHLQISSAVIVTAATP